MGVTQVISDLKRFSANIADFRHLYSPEINKRFANIDIIPEKGKYFFTCILKISKQRIFLYYLRILT